MADLGLSPESTMSFSLSSPPQLVNGGSSSFPSYLLPSATAQGGGLLLPTGHGNSSSSAKFSLSPCITGDGFGDLLTATFSPSIFSPVCDNDTNNGSRGDTGRSESSSGLSGRGSGSSSRACAPLFSLFDDLAASPLPRVFRDNEDDDDDDQTLCDDDDDDNDSPPPSSAPLSPSANRRAVTRRATAAAPVAAATIRTQNQRRERERERKKTQQLQAQLLQQQQQQQQQGVTTPESSQPPAVYSPPRPLSAQGNGVHDFGTGNHSNDNWAKGNNNNCGGTTGESRRSSTAMAVSRALAQAVCAVPFLLPPASALKPTVSAALSAPSATATAHNPQQQPPHALRTSCNCKKSKCLKLYCDCFAVLNYCDPTRCNCTQCFNVPAHEDTRCEAIRNTKERNLLAFQTKIADGKNVHVTGCHCKNSHCLKKYCECFNGSALCGVNCKCQSCQNFAGSAELARTRELSPRTNNNSSNTNTGTGTICGNISSNNGGNVDGNSSGNISGNNGSGAEEVVVGAKSNFAQQLPLNAAVVASAGTGYIVSLTAHGNSNSNSNSNKRRRESPGQTMAWSSPSSATTTATLSTAAVGLQSSLSTPVVQDDDGHKKPHYGLRGSKSLSSSLTSSSTAAVTPTTSSTTMATSSSFVSPSTATATATVIAREQNDPKSLSLATTVAAAAVLKKSQTEQQPAAKKARAVHFAGEVPQQATYPFFGPDLPEQSKRVALLVLDCLSNDDMFAMSLVNGIWCDATRDEALWE
jgi:hypothetical protein